MHCYHAYAVKDRIDTAHLPESHLSTPALSYDDFIPNDDDYSKLKGDFTILVMGILCQHVPFFKNKFFDTVTWNIPHQYSKEMRAKSEVVINNIIIVIPDLICNINILYTLGTFRNFYEK